MKPPRKPDTLRTMGIATLLLGLSTVSAPAAGLPAFPGVEGYGSPTPGGRGGRVILVTNLNGSGPGSLQAACDAEGPLGAEYPLWKHVMEGDTPSFLNLIDNGLSDPDRPDRGAWGGRYELYTPRPRKWHLQSETRPIWSDADDEARLTCYRRVIVDVQP